jgi:hypothetical protein
MQRDRGLQKKAENLGITEVKAKEEGYRRKG